MYLARTGDLHVPAFRYMSNTLRCTPRLDNSPSHFTASPVQQFVPEDSQRSGSRRGATQAKEAHPNPHVQRHARHWTSRRRTAGASEISRNRWQVQEGVQPVCIHNIAPCKVCICWLHTQGVFHFMLKPCGAASFEGKAAQEGAIASLSNSLRRCSMQT